MLVAVKEREKAKKDTIMLLNDDLELSKEKLEKSRETQKKSMKMVKEMEAQERGSEIMSSEKKEKAATMDDAKRQSDLLQAHAALSSSNLERGEIASAFAMQVKMLKIRSQQLEERAANDANEAKVTSQEPMKRGMLSSS